MNGPTLFVSGVLGTWLILGLLREGLYRLVYWVTCLMEQDPPEPAEPVEPTNIQLDSLESGNSPAPSNQTWMQPPARNRKGDS